MENRETIPNWYRNFHRIVFAPIYAIQSEENRRRVRMIILLTGFHLALISLAGLRFLAAGELPFPVLIQFVLNSAILALMYTRFLRIGIGLLISTYVISNFFTLLFSDLTNLLYAVTAFVAVSVLLKRRYRLPYALLMIGIALILGWMTANNPQYAVVTHENTVMFAVLGIISVLISTSVTEGDLSQIRKQLHLMEESEQRYRLLTENISDMVTLHTPDGQFLYASPSYIQATGYSTEELLSMSIADLPSLVHPDDLPKTSHDAHQQILDGKSIKKLEYRRRRKDGTYFWVEAHSTPIFGDKGTVVQILLSSRDISERKQNEEAIIHSEARYRQMFESNRAIKLIIEPETGKIKDANTAAVEFYGYSSDQLKLMRIRDIHVLSDEEVDEEVPYTYYQQRSFFEFRHRLASGEVRDVNVFPSSIDTLEGVYLYFIVIDVTSNREIELRYLSLFEQSNDAVFILDLEGNHVQVNQRAAAMLGYQLDEIIGLSYRDLVVPEQHTHSVNVLQRLLAGETLSPYERTFRRKDGSFVQVEVNVEIVHNREGKPLHIQSVIRDITNRKQMEETLKRSEAQLAEAQQITCLGSWHWDTSTDVIVWSDELYNILGVQRESFQATYENYLGLLSPDESEHVRKIVNEAYRKRQPYIFYHSFDHPQKGKRIIHGMGRVITDEQGNVLYVAGTAQDVTELKHTEAALSMRNKYLTTLHQITLDLLNRQASHDLLKVLVNKAAIILDAPYGEIMLKEGENLIVKAFTDNQPFLEADEVKRHEASLSWKAFDTLQPAILEDYMSWSGRRKLYDGLQLRAVADFPITIGEECIGVLGLARSQENAPFTDEQIQIGLMFSQLAALVVDNANQYNAALQEITERKRIEEALRQSEQRAQALLNVIPDQVYRIDSTGRVLDVAGNAAEGYFTPKEMIGRSVYELNKDDNIPLDVVETAIHYLKKTLHDRQMQSFEYQLNYPQIGRQDFEARFVASGDNEVTAIVRNITSRKTMEQALRRRNDYLTSLHDTMLNLLNRQNMQELLQTIVEDASLLLNAPYGELCLKENDELVVKAFTDNQPFLAGDRVTQDEAFLSWKAHDTLRPAVVDDYANWTERRVLYDELKFRACAEFPIAIGEKCIGILGLARVQEKAPFKSEEIQIGMMFSRLAALVVDNANQYNAALQEIAHRKKTEKRLNALTQKLQQNQQMEYEQRVLAESLRDTAIILNSTLELDEILKLILENIKRIIPHDRANIMLVNEGFASVVQHIGWPSDMNDTLAAIKFPVQKMSHLNLMYKTRHSYIIDDIQTVQDWVNLPFGQNPLSYLAAPICVDSAVIGFINLDSMTRNQFKPEHAHRLQAFVNQAAVAIRNAQLYKQSHDLATLEERQRLARDLHDSVTQTLFAASVTSKAIIKQWQQDSTSVGDSLFELSDLTQGALAEMRTLLLELRPNALIDSNLSDLLGQLAATVKGRSRLSVNLEIDYDCLLPATVQIAFFRIAQEALNNLIKHARAQNLYIELKSDDRKIEMLIKDDGRGFDLAKLPSGHFGIRIMKERAAEANIKLQILTEIDQGTTVKAIWIMKGKS